MDFERAVETLASRLQHDFADVELLRAALTHRSAGARHNERLEFLGDALIGFVVAEELYRRFPQVDEGQLTRLRASLVKRETLARIARAMDLGSMLILGEGERKSGGWRRESILANAFEALMGAVYLDTDLHTSRRVVLGLFGEVLEELSPDATVKDPKTRLQEHLQRRGLPVPEYETVDVRGAAHAQSFTVCCRVAAEEVPPATASGTSRRRAEQAAARIVLEWLEPGEAGQEPP